MANSPHTPVHNTIYGLHGRERLLWTEAGNSIAKARRASKDSIQQLEYIIATQQNRLKKLGHDSVGNPSQTLRLRASMEDTLATYRLTLQQIRQSAETLELTWAMLEDECSTVDS
jgi:hypothetical protein